MESNDIYRNIPSYQIMRDAFDLLTSLSSRIADARYSEGFSGGEEWSDIEAKERALWQRLRANVDAAEAEAVMSETISLIRTVQQLSVKTLQ